MNRVPAPRECITHLLDSYGGTVCFDRDLWAWWCVHGLWDGRSSRWSLTKPLHAVEAIERQRRARELREGRPCELLGMNLCNSATLND